MVPAMQPEPVWQVWPRLLLQRPAASQVPGQLSVSSAEVTATQVPVGEQVLQLPGQSAAEQQLACGMQLPVPQGLKPAAHS